MDESPDIKQFLKLGLKEKHLLAEAIWDNLERKTKVEKDYTLQKDQIRMLESELVHYEEDPGEGSEWRLVKNRILSIDETSAHPQEQS